MSETTTAPAAPVTGGDDRVGPVSPPATSQPALSVSDAARMLRKAREGQPTEAGATRPSNAPPAAPAAPAESTQPPAKPATPAEPSAMERSLGLEPGDAAAPTALGTEPSVDIGGQRYSHTQLKDLIERGQDYTRKTQAVAEQARALQEQQQALATALPYLQPEIQRLMEQVADLPPRPDAALLHTDPATYFAQREAYEKALENRDRINGLQAIQQQAHARLMEQQVAQANQQLEAEFPWWADQGERQKARDQLIEFATTKGGFSRQELSMLTDARQLKMLMWGMAYHRMLNGVRPTAAQPSASPVSAHRGTPPPPAPTAAVEQAYAAFEANPSIRAGTALLTARRMNGSR